MSYELNKQFDVRKALLSGTGWMGLAELFRSATSFGVMIILGILLTPSDFGIVGMTDVFVALFLVFMELGLENAIVQNPDMDDEILSTLFWVNLGLSLVFVMVGVAIAPALGWFYQESRVVPVFSVLSVSLLFRGLSVVQRGLLRRWMKFQKFALVNGLATFIAAIIALVVAYLNGSYWSLVALHLGNSIFATIGFWIASPWMPQRKLAIKKSVESLRFSANLVFFNLLNFFTTRLDVIIIGRFLGATELGFYLLANNLIMKPIQQILNVVGRALYPILASLQNNPQRVQRVFAKYMYALFAILSPFIVVAALVVLVLIPFQMGEKWAPVVPILWVWCFGALRAILASRIGLIYLTMGRPDLQWKYQLLATPVALIGITIGINFGALGTAIGYNIAQTIMLVFGLQIGLKLVDVKIVSYLAEFNNSFVALLVMGVSGGLLSWILSRLDFHPYLFTLFVGGFSIIAYVLTFWRLEPNAKTAFLYGKSMALSEISGLKQKFSRA